MAKSRRLLPLFFALYCAAVYASTQTMLSFDCGARSSYNDSLGLEWSTDEGYIQTGLTATVQTGKSMSRPFTTLRYFPTRKKSCYSIPSDAQGSKILVRTQFYYGNYDNKLSPPTFDLQFDGNLWATVVTSGDGPVIFEMIYVTMGDSVIICVAQTLANNIPFISSIEIRTLGSDMYTSLTTGYAWLTNTRKAYGSPSLVRYPDDAVDRLWLPSGEPGNGLTVLSSNASDINTKISEQPPAAVLQHAVAPTNPNSSIVLTLVASSTPLLVHYLLYFSETAKLSSSEARSFFEIVGGENNTDPIEPPYAGVTEVYSNESKLFSADTKIELVPTPTSTLPPLINAMEVFVLRGPLTNGTSGDDVRALSAIKKQFEQLRSWTGDPCLPDGFPWDWLNCSSATPPRVTALYLSGFGLKGPLPDFSALDALEIIQLQNNSLSGAIPEYFGSFPNLKELNLADNSFSGSVPSSLTTNRNIKLDVSGNSNLCSPGDSCRSSTKKKVSVGVIIGIIIPCFLVFCAFVFVIFLIHKRQQTAIAAAMNTNHGPMTGGPVLVKPNVPYRPSPQPFPPAGGDAQGAYQHSPGNYFTLEIQQPPVPDDTTGLGQQDQQEQNAGADDANEDNVAREPAQDL